LKTTPDCIPCIFRQVLDASRQVTGDEWLHRKVMFEIMQYMPEIDFDRTPPEVASDCLLKVNDVLGTDDPYRAEKQRLNSSAAALQDRARKAIRSAPDRLLAAARFAIAGNVLDVISRDALKPEDVISNALSMPLAVDHSTEFAAAVNQAKNIVYVLDNAGEVMFDRLLIEQLHGKKIVAVVRKVPLLNDVTKAEAAEAGLDRLCEVIDTGCECIGVPMNVCSSEFKERLNSADLVISKGQGNFETLDESPLNVYFLFLVKCARVGAHVDLPVGSALLMRGRGTAAKSPSHHVARGHRAGKN
jgi:uncharacterized protein with ATP-grasp and redox domains